MFIHRRELNPSRGSAQAKFPAAFSAPDFGVRWSLVRYGATAQVGCCDSHAYAALLQIRQDDLTEIFA